MKTVQACQQCRGLKKKCQRLNFGVTCVQCARRGIACSYNLKQTLQHSVELLPNPGRQGFSIANLPRSIIQEVVEHYFYYIHDRPHSLFHKPSLLRAVSDQSLSKLLLCAICGHGARFHANPEVRSLGPKLTEECKHLLNIGIENVCLENVQASLLAGTLSASDLNSTSEALYCGLATRMAFILRLNIPDPSDKMLFREVKLRVWWSLYMNDRWSSSRLRLPRQITDSEKSPYLPMDECSFHGTSLSSTLAHRQPGIWAHMITLVRVFGPIQDLNQRLASNEIEGVDIEAQVDLLVHEIDAWERTLPAEVKQTDHNLRNHVQSGTGGQFVALHLGYHHYSTLLFFQFLDTPTAPRGAGFAHRCKAHASDFSALLKTARETAGCEAVYATVGQMAMVSSAVLLHTLMFGAEEELAAARASLSSNFESLVQLRKYWPASLGRAIERLVTFQNACLASASSTHKIDRWMIRFLLEHSLPLSEKPSITDIAEESADFAKLPSPQQRFAQRGRLTNDALIGLLS